METECGLQLDELDQLALRVGRVITKGLGIRSRWALRTALDAAETEGIGGICVTRIPPKTKDYIDVSFTIGTADVVHRWGDTA